MVAYPDKYWRAAYKTALGLAGNGPVLVPEVFDDTGAIPYSEMNAATDYEVIVAQKDALLTFPRNLISRLADYETVFDNNVFFVLKRPGLRAKFQRKPRNPQAHMKEVMRRVSGMGPQLDFVHIPKTAGTSVTQILRSTSIGYRYFSTHHALSACADINEYSTIAGHFYLSKLLEKRGENTGEVFTIVRNPIDRFLSAVGHARRAQEDPESFGPSMRAMRTMPLMEFMDTKFAGVEVAQTSWMLGHPSKDGSILSERFSIAENYVRQGHVKIFDQSNLVPLTEYLRKIRNHDGEIKKLNLTKNRDNSLSETEQAFCRSDEFKSYFRDEIEFYELLYCKHSARTAAMRP